MTSSTIFNKHVVIVGGGAGGLELATRLGRAYARKGLQVTLVDEDPTHIWKPLLHEVASGSLDPGIDELNYRAQARSARFKFQIGRLENIDRTQKILFLAPVTGIDGEVVLPIRTLSYDYLVLAVGSQTHDFGIEGVREHCAFLDNRYQAERFHHHLLEAWLRASSEAEGHLRIAIVGAGATGVELSAEIFHAAKELGAYGLSKLNRSQLEVTLIEAGPRILGALPERLSSAAHVELEKLGVKIKTNTQVAAVTQDHLMTQNNEEIKAELKVWAAGIKAPDFLRELDGLEVNARNQLVVNSDLRSTLDPSIFAIGDCAACLMPDGKSLVPPRAQAAHQMASFVFKQFKKVLENEPLPAYEYKDYGSMVSLSNYSTVGSLMGNLSKGSMMIEGKVARIVYVSLYRLHQIALYGFFKTALIAFVARINRVIRPRLKLH